MKAGLRLGCGKYPHLTKRPARFLHLKLLSQRSICLLSFEVLLWGGGWHALLSWWLSGPHSLGDTVDLTLLLLQVRCPLAGERAFLFASAGPCSVPHGREGPQGRGSHDSVLSPSTAQHPGNLCPNHEDNLLGDILCS